MTDFNFGQIVLMPFPFTDQTASKKRPAVVVNSSSYYRSRSDLIVMAITSQIHAKTFGDFVIADWKSAGLL